MWHKPSRRLFLSLFGVAFFTVSNLANAYWYNSPGFHNWYFSGGYAAWGGYNGSTYEGDYLRGMGAYIDAVGRLRVNNAKAAIHFQKAYKLYLENRREAAKLKYELRKMREDYEEAHKKKPTPEQIAAFQKAKEPVRLASNQRDPQTGALAWPLVLKRVEFEEGRNAIEELFIARATRPEMAGEGSDNYNQIIGQLEDMRTDLNAIIAQVSTRDWSLANRFLKTLASEARFAK